MRASCVRGARPQCILGADRDCAQVAFDTDEGGACTVNEALLLMVFYSAPEIFFNHDIVY